MPLTPADNPSPALARALEALLFAADRPLDVPTLAHLVDDAAEDDVRSALAEVSARFDGRESGIELVQVGGGYQLRTPPDLGSLVSRLLEAKPVKLSRAAMETLAIVAYRQPATRADVEELRGVDSAGVMRVLMDLGLIGVAGRRAGVGRPLEYGTTQRFLEFFGLPSLDVLPRLHEVGELSESHLFKASTPGGANHSGAPTEDEPVP